MQQSSVQAHEAEIQQLSDELPPEELRAIAALICWAGGLMSAAGYSPAWMVLKAARLLEAAHRKERAGG